VRPEGAAADGDSATRHTRDSHARARVLKRLGEEDVGRPKEGNQGSIWRPTPKRGTRARVLERLCAEDLRRPKKNNTEGCGDLHKKGPETATCAPKCSNVFARKMLGDLRKETRVSLYKILFYFKAI